MASFSMVVFNGGFAERTSARNLNESFECMSQETLYETAQVFEIAYCLPVYVSTIVCVSMLFV